MKCNSHKKLVMQEKIYTCISVEYGYCSISKSNQNSSFNVTVKKRQNNLNPLFFLRQSIDTFFKIMDGNDGKQRTYTMLRMESLSLTEYRHLLHCATEECTYRLKQ